MTTAVRWLSGITAVLVLIQAVLIGQALYVNGMTTVELHGWLGSASFVLAIILAGAAFMGYRRGELGSAAVGLAAVVALLMVAQLGLGYSGRRGGMPAALHIPNGVLIAGLLFALISTTLAPRSGSGQIRA
jgi:hypothetical protein